MTVKPRESATRKGPRPSADVAAALHDLERHASKRFRIDMSTRYGIVTSAIVYGTPMARMKVIARSLGRDHVLADGLWRSGVHDARMLATMVDDPSV